MHVGNRYKVIEFIIWTRRDIYKLLLISSIITVLYELMGFHFLAIPWVPVALIGTAGAFMIGFKNTQSYNRLWEARQIWGGIVNNSRELSFMFRDFIETEPQELKTLYYRHFAWLTALRFQLREQKPWENHKKPHNREYRKFYSVPEWEGRLDSILESLLTVEELNDVMNRKSKSAYIMSLQSEHLKKLYEAGKIDTYKQIEIEKKLGELIVNQGKCERIKNFPYPRQYASINYYFVWLLVLIMPMGLISEFHRLGEWYTWLTIPFCTIASWVFTSMEKIGEASENPFEGGANDIPMASISRNIEIEMRDLLNEKELPEAILPVNNIVL